MQGVRDLLLQRSGPGSEGLLYVGELKGRHVHHKMDHLVCFLPGALLHRVTVTRDMFSGKGEEAHCLSASVQTKLRSTLVQLSTDAMLSSQTALPPKVYARALTAAAPDACSSTGVRLAGNTVHSPAGQPCVLHETWLAFVHLKGSCPPCRQESHCWSSVLHNTGTCPGSQLARTSQIAVMAPAACWSLNVLQSHQLLSVQKDHWRRHACMAVHIVELCWDPPDS